MIVVDPEGKDSLKSFHDPTKEILETLKALRFHDPAKEILESLKTLRFHDPAKEILESLKTLRFHDPTREILESLKALQNSLSTLQHLDAENGIKKLLSAISEKEWPLAYEKSNVEINADGTITSSSRTLSQLELQNITVEILDRVLDHTNDRIDLAVERLINEIRSLKDPLLEKILTWFIFPLVVGFILLFIAPVVESYLEKTLTADKRSLRKQINKEVIESTGNKECLDTYRFVKADVLNVRSKGSRKSPVIGTLYFGQVVELVEKGRSWSLVKWNDEEKGISLQGWVFSRYLQNFR